MVLGVDFDNTIVRYDDLFHRIAVERGLVPADLRPRKNDVRDYLRKTGRENAWTELQGHVYGPRMFEARPFPGVLEFFRETVRRKLPVYIISHKTQRALVGPAYNLQETAREWLFQNEFFDTLSPDCVFFGAEPVVALSELAQHQLQFLRRRFGKPHEPQGGLFRRD